MHVDRWDPAPSILELPADEVHVWRATLNPSTLDPEPSTLLAPDERARADRFYFDRDRRRYVAGRASLRTILGRYLGCSPQEIAFEYGPQGKPALAAARQGSRLSFNASHSHELGLFAVTRSNRVGVDVEHAREIAECRGIARRYFTAAEAVLIDAEAEPGTPFLRLWTRKEAVIKAVGVGLSMPLNCFDLSAVPGDGTVAFAVDDPAAKGAAWTLHELDPGPNYLGAVVSEGSGLRLRQFELG